MTKLACIPAIAVAGLVTLASPAVAFEQKETERVDRTVSIRSGGQLRLKNFSGKVVITGGTRGDISVHAVRRADRDRLDHIKLEIVETGSGVTIEANKKDSDWHERDNNVVETDFDIQVPDDVTLDVQVFSSDVKIVDVRGRQRVHTFSGEIDVAGVAGSVDAETFSGDITVKLAQAAGGHVDFDSFSGSLHSDVPMLYRSGSRRRIQGDIGSGANDYRFKTFSGDVSIR
jgi:putative adhesin